MPTALPTTSVRLTVKNLGTQPHGFVIEGNGLRRALDEPLQPNKEAKLEIELPPGTYRAYSPVDADAERGLALQVIVQEPPGTSTSG